MITPEPPAVPPLYWDGCQFYADAGKGTHYVDAPYEGRYAVMYLTSSGHWAHQGNVDELPEAVMRLNLPTDIEAAAAPDTGQARTLREFADDVERRLPLLREPDEHSDWSDGVAWVLDRMRNAAAEPSRDTVQAPDGDQDELGEAARRLDAAAVRVHTGASRVLRWLATDLRDARGAVGADWARPTACALLGTDTTPDPAPPAVQLAACQTCRGLLLPGPESDTWRHVIIARDADHAGEPTPDRLAWIDTAAETAAVERQARYQETACARRPAEERPDA